MKASKNTLVILIAGASIIAQLLNPIPVFADGETPPPPVETIKATEPPLPTDVIPTETPSASDVPTIEPVITETPAITTEPIEPPTGIVEPSALTPQETAQDTAKGATLLEVVQDVSNDTNIAVLDETGQPAPLATQVTAEIIENGDPMWCPSGVSPVANTGGCTGSYLTMQDLLTNSGTYINGRNSNGTIWITSGFIGDVNAVTIDGFTYPNWANYALTLQGGWTGTNSGTIDPNQNSIFTVPISILNWLGNITINNITIQDTAASYSPGLDLQTNGSVIVNNGTFKNNYIGTSIRAAGNVNVAGSTFRENQWDGLQIFTDTGVNNTITIHNNSFAYNNRNNTDGYGLWLITDFFDSGSLTMNHFINNERGASISGSPSIMVGSDNEFNLNCLDYSISAYFYPYYYYYYEQPGNYCGDPIEPPTPVQPITLTTRAAGSKFTLDCTSQNGFSVPLPNGDLVEIFCPVSGEAEIARLDNTILPKALPAGYTYASAFELKIIQSDKPIPVINDTGYIRASFVAPSLSSLGNTYSVLYLGPNDEDWIVLKDYMRDGNGSRSFYLDALDPTRIDVRRKVISGVQLVTSHKDDRVEVSTNFPGIFVLAQH